MVVIGKKLGVILTFKMALKKLIYVKNYGKMEPTSLPSLLNTGNFASVQKPSIATTHFV